jgi:ABC-type transporter Mla subunit MlaD
MLDIQKLDRELYDRKETIVAINKQMGELADSQSSEAQRNEELSAKVSQLTGELADKQNLL